MEYKLVSSGGGGNFKTRDFSVFVVANQLGTVKACVKCTHNTGCQRGHSRGRNRCIGSSLRERRLAGCRRGNGSRAGDKFGCTFGWLDQMDLGDERFRFNLRHVTRLQSDLVGPQLSFPIIQKGTATGWRCRFKFLDNQTLALKFGNCRFLYVADHETFLAVAF